MKSIFFLLLLLLPGFGTAQTAAEGAEVSPPPAATLAPAQGPGPAVAPPSGPPQAPASAAPAAASPVPAAVATSPPPGARPAPAAAGRLSPAELDRLAALLRDETRRGEFLRLLDTLAAAQRAQPGAAGAPVPAVPAAAPAGQAPVAAAPAPAPAAPAVAAAAPAATPAVQASPAEPAASPAAAPAAPAAAPSAATPPATPLLAPNTVGAQLLLGLSERMATLSDEFLGALRSMADVEGLWQGMARVVQDPVGRARLMDAAWKLLLLLGLGVVAELLVAGALAPLRRRLQAAAPADFSARSWLKRVPLVLGQLLLSLVPIAGFLLAFHGLLGFLDPLPTTRRVGLLVLQAYLGARLAFAVASMLLSPRSNHLRLIPCSDGVAAYCIGWLRRLMLIGVGGYTLAEAGIFFGLSWVAYDALLRLTLLAITISLVRIILQQRGHVAAVLHSQPLAPGDKADGGRRALRALRDGLAQWWHVLAILWLVAFWVVWALEIEQGFRRLVQATLLSLVLAGAAKAIDEGLRRLLAWGLKPGPELAARYPGLQLTAARYLPVLQGMVSLAVVAGVVLLLLEAWGVDALDWFAVGTLGQRLVDTLLSIGLTLALGVVVWEVTNGAIQRHLAKLAREQQAARSARLRTLLPMLRTALGAVIAVFVVLNALDKLGVNVAPLLAGAGVIGLAVGFGAQSLVRDVITGIFLLLEDAVAVGDVAQLGGQSGVVEYLSIRSIKLRAMDGSLHIIPFSAVTTVTNMTRDFSFAVLDVTVGYGEDTDRVADVLREIGGEMRTEAKWNAMMRDDIEVIGVERLADSGVVIRARIKAEPAARWSVARELNRRVKRRFDELGIEIPYPHQKLVMDKAEPRLPFAPQAAE